MFVVWEVPGFHQEVTEDTPIGNRVQSTTILCGGSVLMGGRQDWAERHSNLAKPSIDWCKVGLDFSVSLSGMVVASRACFLGVVFSSCDFCCILHWSVLACVGFLRFIVTFYFILLRAPSNWSHFSLTCMMPRELVHEASEKPK